MQMHFHKAGSRARHDWAEDHALDVVLRLDDAGFVIHASPNATTLGVDLSSLLLMPHICDFADVDYADQIASLFARARAGDHPGKWIDFPLPILASEEAGKDVPTGRCWYAIWLEPVVADDGAGHGCIAILRSVQSRYAMADEIEALSATDPLTGLDNRPAFCGNLARLLAHETEKVENTVALFAIDRMRALFIQYGQQTADEIRWGFARYLEAMTHNGLALALLDEERFAVLLPGMSVRAARTWAEDVLNTFAGLTAGVSSKAAELTASAGLARVEKSVDWTLRQAEMGLVMARAGGGMKVGTCRPVPGIADGAQIEKAIHEALFRAEQRAL